MIYRMIEDRALGTAKVAKALDTSEDTVLRIIGGGHLRAWTLGRHLKVNQSEVNRFLRDAELVGHVPTVTTK